MMSDTPPTSTAKLSQERWLDLNDDALLKNCRFENFRGSGPGGQKRNKTSNAVRLTHLPTCIHVLATESRSLAENKTRAVRRLKLKLAIEIRHPVDTRGFEPPDWFGQVVQLGRLSASHRNEHYARLAALLLDLLVVRTGSFADVGKLLGVTTSSVVKLLREEPALWTAASHVARASSL
jgi:hypothetical protein